MKTLQLPCQPAGAAKLLDPERFAGLRGRLTSLRHVRRDTLVSADEAFVTQSYIEPTQQSGRAFFSRGIRGKVVMLNLLRYREIADYSGAPQLAPAKAITGEAAYRLYMQHTAPYLEESGGKVLFFGKGGGFLIGPESERWDAVMLVEQASTAAFMEFASNADYLAGIGHRTAALEDSRLLPLEQGRL